jgi:succinate-acetate transporter protein
MAVENTPQVNPAGLGLASFGLTTVLLSLINAGLLPAGGENVVLPLAMALGGTAQIIAGILEVRTGNTFGTTAFIAYGAFWWWFALLLMLGHNGILDLKEAGSTIGAALVLWGVFTLYMWIATFRLNRVVFLVFLTLWVTFFLLGPARCWPGRCFRIWAACSASCAERWRSMAASPSSPTARSVGRSCRWVKSGASPGRLEADRVHPALRAAARTGIVRDPEVGKGKSGLRGGRGQEFFVHVGEVTLIREPFGVAIFERHEPSPARLESACETRHRVRQIGA